MEISSLPSNRDNCRSNNCVDISTINCIDYPFFNDSHKKSSGKIEKHHKKIISKYDDWFHTPFPVDVDLHTLDLDRLNIAIIGSVIPLNTELNKKNQTLDEMALSHLNCKDYKETYGHYKKILECQNNFNEQMKDFLNKTKERINKLVNSTDNDRIELLLRYYLYKITAASRQPKYFKGHLDHFDESVIVSLNPRIDLSNPFHKEEERKIKQDLKENYDEVINTIDKFKKDISNLNKSISGFQDSLYRIISDDDIKGICSIEKRTFSGKIKSFLHLC